jgi:hypothetical protein
VAQADMVVQPNSQYFSGWAFASITQPAAKPIPAGTPLVGMLGQRAFTITASGNTTPALDNFTTWGSATTNLGSVSLPADIGLLTPSAAANLWEIDRGELVYVFLDPLPAGTTLFSHDFDNGESVDYRFFRCDGTQIDASGFEFMQIATAGNPSTITRPAAGVADSVWHIAGVGTANNNITSGLILNSAEVCSIKTFSNNTTGRGSVDFTLGALAASLVRPVVAVPALGWPGMALLGVALAGLAAWRRRRG